MKILGKKILLAPVTPRGVSRGGIIIPETSFKDGMEAVVVAIGSQITESLPFRKNSRVFIEFYKAKPVEIDGTPCLTCDLEDICGIAVGNDNNYQFHPIGDKILLKPVSAIASGNLIIPTPAFDQDEAKYKDHDLACCTVHLMGVGVKNKKSRLLPFDVKIGDTVYIQPFIGRDVDSSSGTFKLVKHSDILAKHELIQSTNN